MHDSEDEEDDDEGMKKPIFIYFHFTLIFHAGD